MYKCGKCPVLACRTGEKEKMPLNCPCKDEEIITKSKELYKETENRLFARNSALVESSGYCKLTRLEEIMDFAKRLGFKKIGVAFCVGLKEEMKSLNKILTYNDFNVESIICKNGSISKSYIGINKEEQIRINCEFEAMCNPIGQALLLNKAETDLNLIFGLCVGHDSLFIKYSNAPVTVLAVKDRVLGHNPLAAIYLSEGYYKKRMFPEKE
jgi:uncharacterized metal-binding protein